MINATNPSVSNQNLPPPSLDQEETSTATGANTSAAASTQSQTATPVAEQGITQAAYDANFVTTREPAGANSNQMLMINPNGVNPNATQANVQRQIGPLANANTASGSTLGDTSLTLAQRQGETRSGVGTPLSATEKVTVDPNAKPLTPQNRILTGQKAAGGKIDSREYEISNIATYRQNAGPWTRAAYIFADPKSKDTFGVIGCTTSAVSNASSVTPKGAQWMHGIIATPGDINARNGNWETARDRTQWNNLISPSKNVNYAGKLPSDKSAKLDNTLFGVEKGVTVNSPQGKTLLDKIRAEVQAGRPVVLGMTGRPPGAPRHSIVVTGLIPGVDGAKGLIVRDNWRGPNGDGSYYDKPTTGQQVSYKTTLDETLTSYRATKIDKAVSATPKQK